MADLHYVIVGGGLAAASAIEGIREVDHSGPITLLTAERELPYHRPPLSKTFLAGKDTVDVVRVHDAAWYRDQKVRVRLGQTAKSVHIAKQGVTLQTGERVSYDRLLIATGCSARRLVVPGADAQGILYLRTLQDSYALRGALKAGARLVIVGGGFIGVEVAATAAHLGVKVTLLEMGPALYRAFASPELSALFRKVLESQGVNVRTNVRVARFANEGGKLSAVVTESGEQVPADIALVGVGAEPNTAWLGSSGFQIDRGALIVNVRLETPGKNVWAAGDVTRFPDPLTRQPRRLEHWGNALAQGKHAGRNMAGAAEPFRHQAAFFSDIFDLTINVLGETDQPERVELRGSVDPAAPNFTALYLRAFKLMGAVTVNPASVDRTAEFDALQKHIGAGTIPETENAQWLESK
jgi:3-phenylpropionate/trans-cinnamate dioxygenase ferredoxin reductase subunit